jgi:hypothetical protein
MKTNTELLRTAYQATHMAADEITMLSQRVDRGAVITSAELLPKVRALRNELRRAFCAVQELKTRAKKELNRKKL